MKKEKLYNHLLEKQRRLCDSLFYFAKYLIGFSDMEEQPHLELCNFVQYHDSKGHDQLILLPRGTFKSSVVSVAFPIWKWIKNRNLRFLLTSGELLNSKNFLGLIRTHLERNTPFRSIFGDWAPGEGEGPWHSTTLSLGGRTRFRAEHSIIASSLKVSKVSQHYDVAINDDLHNEKNVKSREMIDEIMHYLELQIPILDPVEKGSDKPGPRMLVGTRWTFDDAYGRIIAGEDQRKRDGLEPAFHTLIKKAVTKSGKVYFPARFSAEYLKRLKRDMNMSDYTFSCQYMNDPQPEETQVFKLLDLGFFHSTHRVMGGVVLPMPRLLNMFTTVDPGLEDNVDSCYTAIVTDAVDEEYNMYCWDVVREKYPGPDDILKEMFLVRAKFQPLRFGIEAVLFQRSLVWGFKKLARERGSWFHVEPLKTDTRISKELRIKGFQPFVAGRKFYLRVKEKTDLTLPPKDLYYALVDGQDILADEMLRFPLGATVDCLDAQAYMPQLVHPAPKEQVVPPGPGTFGALRMALARRGKESNLLTVK